MVYPCVEVEELAMVYPCVEVEELAMVPMRMLRWRSWL